MSASLTKGQRNLLARVTLEAREVAETAARAALENLAVHEQEYRGHMTVDQRLLRNRLRARGRALGDRLDPRTGTQAIDHLAESAAYEHWHRLLFTRFLAENHLLHTDEALGTVPVTLEECDELAAELGARDGFELACRFASQTLPGVFRRDDPVLELRLAPNHEVQLRRLLDQLPPEVFRADDALGWTYQFWQAKRKEQINRSGVKIGADELPAVTQLFTEDYMVEFLLHNSLGAWWAGRRAAVDSGQLSVASCPTEADARRAVSLPTKDGLPGIDWTYLRFARSDADAENAAPDSLTTDHRSPVTAHWRPAAGTFDGWPRHAAEIRFLDPCMGSGHFLVFALPILARLRVEEEGLAAAEAVAAVLRDNLHGLEIDERCTQIAAFNVALTAWRLGGYQAVAAAAPGLLRTRAHTTRGRAASLPVPPERDLPAPKRPSLRPQGRHGATLRPVQKARRFWAASSIPGTWAATCSTAEFHHLQPLLGEGAGARGQRHDPHELAVTAQGVAKAAEILAGAVPPRGHQRALSGPRETVGQPQATL